jgi:16S rRNA pseudouridine516 synthase
MTKERIQKIIAAAGIHSRRAVEQLIEERKIKVNGVVVTAKGHKADPEVDRIQVAGKAFVFKRPEVATCVLINKPRQILVSKTDPLKRKTVYDLLPKKYQNLRPVGRLDYNSQGALLLTDDGDMILKLTHPRYHLDKIYEVKLSSHPEPKQIQLLQQGIILDGVRTLPATVTLMKQNKASTVLKFVLNEGKNRQIRRMCESVGLTVKELKRLSIGPIKLKNLRSGQYRVLLRSEMKSIMTDKK